MVQLNRSLIDTETEKWVLGGMQSLNQVWEGGGRGYAKNMRKIYGTTPNNYLINYSSIKETRKPKKNVW